MALKPGPRTAALVKERVQEVLHNGKLSPPEQEAMANFDADLEHYLK
ncbi:hypothetical protein [Halapricum desulfuricans]|nr:hypothetical protein [Halapricum desulfuricans]